MQQPESSLHSFALPQGDTLDMQAGSRDVGHASLSKDSIRLQGLLQQPPLDSVAVAGADKHVSPGPVLSVRPSSAGSQGQSRSSRKQPRPHSAAALTTVICPDVPPAQAVKDTDAQDCQPGPALACRSECHATVSAILAAAVLPSVETDARPLPGGRLLQRHKSSTASNMISASSKSLDAQAVEALAITESMLSSSHLQPAEASSEYLHCEGSSGTEQPALDTSTVVIQDLRSDPAQGAFQDLRADAGPTMAEDRLKAILQDTSLQELAALLTSEESENESDFSEDSGSASGDGSADDADRSTARISSCAEFAHQPEVQSAPNTAPPSQLCALHVMHACMNMKKVCASALHHVALPFCSVCSNTCRLCATNGKKV